MIKVVQKWARAFAHGIDAAVEALEPREPTARSLDKDADPRNPAVEAFRERFGGDTMPADVPMRPPTTPEGVGKAVQQQLEFMAENAQKRSDEYAAREKRRAELEGDAQNIRCPSCGHCFDPLVEGHKPEVAPVSKTQAVPWGQDLELGKKYRVVEIRGWLGAPSNGEAGTWISKLELVEET